jgi:hypothetical protein
MEQVVQSGDFEDLDFNEFYKGDTTNRNSGSASNAKSKDSSGFNRNGQVLDVMNPHNLGTLMFALIPDKVITIVDGKSLPRLYRKVNHAYLGRTVDPTNPKYYMNIQIPSYGDFADAGVKLDSAQYDQLNRLREQAKNFTNFTSYQNAPKFPSIAKLAPKLSYVKQPVFTYGKIVKFISSARGEVKDDAGLVRLLRFTKGDIGKTDFVTSILAAISNKSAALNSNAWMKEWFNRTPGTRNKVVSVNISRANTGFKPYSLTTSLETVADFEVTTEDLEIASNMNERVFTISHFDQAYYDKVEESFKMIQSTIDKLTQ